MPREEAAQKKEKRKEMESNSDKVAKKGCIANLGTGALGEKTRLSHILGRIDKRDIKKAGRKKRGKHRNEKEKRKATTFIS